MKPIFREIQHAPAWWWLLLVMPSIVIAGVIMFVEQDAPTWLPPFVILMSGFPMLFFGRMSTEIDRAGITVRLGFIPIIRKRIDFQRIAEMKADRYDALREYGGWGYKVSRKGKAMMLAGDLGVRIVTENGERWLIGSNNPDGLLEAVRQARSA